VNFVPVVVEKLAKLFSAAHIYTYIHMHMCLYFHLWISVLL